MSLDRANAGPGKILTMHMETAQERWFWSLVLIALFLLLCLWGNGDIPFLSVNEARRAVTVREMYEAGNWLIPHMNGELYLAKPPLFYWLALLPVELSGRVSEWAMRLPSALSALAVLAGVYMAGSRIAGRRLGILACVFLAANAGFSIFARRAEIEMTLTAFCFLALLSAWFYLFHDPRRRWVLLSYTLLGCSLLTKGPVSLLLVTVPLVAFAIVQRSSRARTLLCDRLGWLIAIAIGASWYCVVTLQQGVGIWASIFQQDIVNKVGGSQGEPWYAYLGYLAGDFFPFWLLLFARPRQLWKSIRGNAELMLLACVVLVPLVIFSVFSDKHAKYLLPIYPALALLLAWHWGTLFDAWQGWKQRVLAWLPVIALGGFVVFFVILEPRVFAYRVEALPQVSQAVRAHPAHALYSIGEPDMRLVYYAGHPVKPVTAEAVESLAAPDAQLFVAGAIPTSLHALEPCVTEHFKPVLKHGKEAWLIALGRECAGR